VDIGAPELIIVLGVALLVFGPSKLPGLARSMGQSLREFRDTLHGDERRSASDDVE
jgi:sec-independent protein translocase protein TatA